MMMSAQSDRSDSTSVSLLKRLGQPENQRAWDRFVQLYTPLLFYWAHKAGLDSADAGDLVQDVFCILVRKLPTFDYDASKSFRSWLKTVLQNTLINRRRRKLPQTQPDMDLLPPQPQANEAIKLEEAEYRQYLVARAVELMQAEFEPKTWQACWRLVVMGRPGAEVAQELGMSVNAVYLAKSRVLAALRSELEGLWD